MNGGCVSSLDRLAECFDEVGSITSSGVPILASKESVHRAMLQASRLPQDPWSVGSQQVTRKGLLITRLGSPVASLRRDFTSQRMRKKLIYVEITSAVLYVPGVGANVAPVRQPIAAVCYSVASIGGNITRMCDLIAVVAHPGTLPRTSP